MGAYLSEPIVEKISCDEKSDEVKLSYGACSMQGWRVSQEDAHNCILTFDTDTSLFAVYDGHGGHEVAAYCAEHLPEFLKKLESYKQGDMGKALEEAYLGFDQHLTKEDIVKVLHCIAGNKPKEAASEEDPDEMNDLYEEATMSIEELITRYGKRIRENIEDDGGSKASAAELVSKLNAKVNQKIKDSESANVKNSDSSGNATEKVDTDEKIEVKTESSVEPAAAATTEESSEINSVNQTSEPVNDQNGKVQNGCNNHENHVAKTNDALVSKKGKGVGKGLSNCIRKSVEKTPEELEIERREAEKMAKRQERKKSLRSKSGDELYKAMVSNNEEEDSDEDGDDEEDEDFDGETSSDDEPGVGDEEDDKEDDDDDDEDEWEDQEDEEEVATKAKTFSMNLKEEPGSDSGCTAVLGLLRGNKLYVANAGDSRCVLSRQGRAIPLSADHKPEDEPERSRIERAGGVVTADGRVNGGLNLSRAIGDHAYKQNTELGPKEQMITALPDIQTIDLEEGDEFIVLACDGIWNSKTNQQVIDFVRPRLLESKPLSKICEELFDECLAPNTLGDGTGCDNMTAIIVRLDRFMGENKASSEDVSTVSSTKRPLNEENSPESAQPNEEDEVSHKNKKQRMDENALKEDVANPSEVLS